ncbi:MAG: hypothetical protein A2X78_03825 [Gammaproteobacteria bacterium GWE2_37_16]|nr:MAG: hypothetical protein A2X78_03825 [Gammaproteobacteria bacterium GWE2_37_16]
MKNKLLKIISAFLFFAVTPNSYAALYLHTQILGISGPTLENIKNRLTIKQKTEFATITPQSIQGFYKTAPKEIELALQPFGYFHAQITSQLTSENNQWYATYKIKLGQPVQITSLDIKIDGQGANDPIFKNFLATSSLHVGMPLQTEQYEDTKKSFLDLALSNGYLQANIEQNVLKINPLNNTSTIILHFNTGHHYKIGNVNFTTDAFSKDFLDRFLPFQKSNFYTAQKIQELQNNLTNSNFFSQVSIIPQTNTPQNDTIPIEVLLTPRKKVQYDLGLGYGTDTGVRGLAGIGVRHLTKTGQSFNTLIKYSQTQRDLEIHYLIPGKNPVTDRYDLSAAAEVQNQSYGNSQAFKISAGYITSIFQDWQQTLRLSLQQERYNYVDKPKQNSFFLIPSYNLLHIETDNPVKPTRGHRINITIQGSADSTISDMTFLQTQIDLKYLHPLSSVNSIVLRGTVGYTAINNILSLPLSLQYFTGGAQTVRGYNYNKFGPGRHLLIGSAELRQKIISDWYAIGFFDAGNAGSSFFNIGLKRGVGLGMIWLSPVGTISLSYAKALDSPGNPGMIQFSMGPEF